jgi:hypothetical protein
MNNMTWEWSHTTEAYENVRNNIFNLDIETLKECVIEIWTYQQCLSNETNLCNLLGEDVPDYYFSKDYYDTQIAERIRNSEKLDNLCLPELSEIVWEFASTFRECNNGGHYALISPYHTWVVSLNNEEVENE